MSATIPTNSDQTKNPQNPDTEEHQVQTTASATGRNVITPDDKTAINRETAAGIATKHGKTAATDDGREASATSPEPAAATADNVDATQATDTDAAKPVDEAPITNSNSWNGTLSYDPLAYYRMQITGSGDTAVEALIKSLLAKFLHALNTAVENPARAAETLQALGDAVDETLRVTSPYYTAPTPPVEYASTIHAEVAAISGTDSVGRATYRPGEHVLRHVGKPGFGPTPDMFGFALDAVVRVFETDAHNGNTDGMRKLAAVADEQTKQLLTKTEQSAPAGIDPFGELSDLFGGKMPAIFDSLFEGLPGFGRPTSGGRRGHRG